MKILALCAALMACGAPHYPLNIAPDPEMAARVRGVEALVSKDRPAARGDDAPRARALLTALTEPGASLGLAFRDLLERGEILAYAFTTQHEGQIAFHEITAGLIKAPFSELIERFDPARRWGEGLYGYLGGEYAQDRAEPEIQARERMVLGTPWYAWGAPDMDMSKHEVVIRAPDRLTVLWEVTASANQSVLLDVGYVRFEAYAYPNGDPGVLISFNSIHRTDPGWFGRYLLWEGMRQSITLEVLRDMFGGHIERYREIYRAQGSSHASRPDYQRDKPHHRA